MAFNIRRSILGTGSLVWGWEVTLFSHFSSAPRRPDQTMDPLSITSGCVGIMGAIVKTSSTIREFVRDVRESRSQLGGTAHQLAELEMTISLVKDDHNAENGSFADHMPESVTRQTATVIQSCRDVLDELDTTMDKYNPRKHRTPLKWAFKGKDEVAALNKQLEAHPRTLQISLEISTLCVIILSLITSNEV